MRALRVSLFSLLALFAAGWPIGHALALPVGPQPPAPVLLHQAQTVTVIGQPYYRPVYRPRQLYRVREVPAPDWNSQSFFGNLFGDFPEAPDEYVQSGRGHKKSARSPERKQPVEKASRAVSKARSKEQKAQKNASIPVARPEPSKQTTTKASLGNRSLSCDAAAGLVTQFAFKEVKPVRCSGSTYEFRAMRQDRSYSVTINAANGTLVKVVKQAAAQP